MTRSIPANHKRIRRSSPSTQLVKLSVSSTPQVYDQLDLKQKDSLKFIFQILLTAAFVVLCTTQLIAGEKDATDKAIYWSGITSTLAWWMPSPGTSKEEKSKS